MRANQKQFSQSVIQANRSDIQASWSTIQANQSADLPSD